MWLRPLLAAAAAAAAAGSSLLDSEASPDTCGAAGGSGPPRGALDEDHESLIQLRQRHDHSGSPSPSPSPRSRSSPAAETVVAAAPSRPSAGKKGKFSAIHPDPGRLRWDSPPAAGDKVRGVLTVPLDYDDANSPSIKLRVTMKFHEVQPPPLGTLLIHRGGPGSDDSLYSSYYVDGFNVWSIAQRGIGAEAEPSLLCSGSHLPPDDAVPPFKVSDFTDCPCALPDGTPQVGEAWADVDALNETQVKGLLAKMMERSFGCYASPKFQLKGKGGSTYNFLDYVGTQMLAMDVDRFREAVGAERLSIHGMSYGTLVGSVYGTSFPSKVDKLVLNGNMMTLPQKTELAKGCAVALDKAIAELLRQCLALPQNCSLSEPEEEYAAIMDMARRGVLTAPTASGRAFPLTVGMLTARLQYLLHSSSGAGWPMASQLLAKLSPKSDVDARRDAVKAILDFYCFVQGKSTWFEYDICVGPGHTVQIERNAKGRLTGDPFIWQTAVLGADTAGRYRLDEAVGAWRTVALEHGDAGTGAFLGIFAGTFDWPALSTPPAPVGSPTVAALVIGNLFDPSTSYLWAQQMRQAFPLGSMMTWQGVGHVLGKTGYDQESIGACHELLTEYLKTGSRPIDGHVCRQHTAVPVR